MNLILRRWRSIAGAALCFLGTLAGCVATTTESYPLSVPQADVVYAIAGGWHTELGLPVPEIGGPLAALKQGFPGARYLVFGWGARGYYMARDPGIGDVLRTLAPGPAVMLVVPLAVSPDAFAGAANTFPISISLDGAAHLSRFLWEGLAKDRQGRLRRAGAGPEPQSVFYAAAGTYDLAHTCNTWTAEALRAAGVPVRADGVVFAGQLLDQLR